jgi:hypothetical protein
MNRPNERQWDSCLDEIEWNVGELRKHGSEAITRTKGLAAGDDGYPRSSLPESSVASGRVGDPTGLAAVSRAMGTGVRDEAAIHVNYMLTRVDDAVKRLREAVQTMYKAIPEAPPDPSREQCQSCGIAKQIATRYGKNPRGWVVADAKCDSCYKRALGAAKRRGQKLQHA